MEHRVEPLLYVGEFDVFRVFTADAVRAFALEARDPCDPSNSPFDVILAFSSLCLLGALVSLSLHCSPGVR